ncbi:hypothetical protein JOE11_002408 [Robbsia andropogonis]
MYRYGRRQFSFERPFLNDGLRYVSESALHRRCIPFKEIQPSTIAEAPRLPRG